jgi:hypothetical protein
MSKRFLIVAITVGAVGALLLWAVPLGLDWLQARKFRKDITEEELTAKMVEQNGMPSMPTAAVEKIDLKRNVRLAIGGIGLADEEQNRRVSDLVLAQLAGARGLEMVERQSFDAVLQELNLSASGLVRAKDAVRVGKLVRADWFLLGSPMSLNGTNFTVVRIVDARTGVLREASVFVSGQSLTQLGSDLAGFIRHSRQNAAEAKSQVYLAVGSFEDLSVNSRQAALPTELRSYLATAYQKTNITLLDREFVNLLLQEVRLDLAGLTDEANPNSTAMQAAYWVVDGFYQSYETTGFEVELVLNVRRMFGRSRQIEVRDKSGEPLFQKVRASIDAVMQADKAALMLTRLTELQAQLAAGKEIFHAGKTTRRGSDLIWLNSDYSGNPLSDHEIARLRRNFEEAIRSFETVLLLDANHREARMYLAACYRQFFINRTEEARGLYRELIESESNDPLNGMAGQALAESFRGTNPESKLRWFEAVNQDHPNAFYQSQIKAANDEIALGKPGTADAERIAEQKLFESVAKWEKDARGGSWMLNFSNMGLKDYVKSFGTNRNRAAEQLAALLPRLQATSSNLAPYLIAGAVIYQVDTNAPVVAQFQQSLMEAASHPESLFGPRHYFSMVSREVINWAAANRVYTLAVQIKKVQERMAQKKYAEPLSDDDKMGLAFSYLEAEAWRPALDIFQSYSDRPVRRGFSGNSKDAFMPVFTGKQANFCRVKLGLPVERDPREFAMGTNCLCLHTPSVFQVDADGLWVGIGGQLLRLGFDLKTNFIVMLPIEGDVVVSVLCPGTSNLWIGTGGAGLIEFDKNSRQCRRLTVKDGLMMGSISALLLAGDDLWIGYGSTEGGGLGRLDLATRVPKSFTLSLAAGADVHRHPTGNMAFEQPDKPPHRKIQALASSPDGEIYFATEEHPLRRYRPLENTWSACPLGSGSCVVAGTKRLFAGSSGGAVGLGVTAWDYANEKVSAFKEVSGLPLQRVSTLTLDGQTLWVGGFGFIAMADANDGSVRQFAYVPAVEVDQIQIGGGYVWAKFDGHLQRGRLQDLR